MFKVIYSIIQVLSIVIENIRKFWNIIFQLQNEIHLSVPFVSLKATKVFACLSCPLQAFYCQLLPFELFFYNLDRKCEESDREIKYIKILLKILLVVMLWEHFGLSILLEDYNFVMLLPFTNLLFVVLLHHHYQNQTDKPTAFFRFNDKLTEQYYIFIIFSILKVMIYSIIVQKICIQKLQRCENTQTTYDTQISVC